MRWTFHSSFRFNSTASSRRRTAAPFGKMPTTTVLRHKLLNRERFRTGVDAKVLIERWRRFYDERWPHVPTTTSPGSGSPTLSRTETHRLSRHRKRSRATPTGALILPGVE